MTQRIGTLCIQTGCKPLAEYSPQGVLSMTRMHRYNLTPNEVTVKLENLSPRYPTVCWDFKKVPYLGYNRNTDGARLRRIQFKESCTIE